MIIPEKVQNVHNIEVQMYSMLTRHENVRGGWKDGEESKVK